MTRREAINFIKRSKAKYFTYGLEGSDLGTPVEKFEAIQDISSMDDSTWEGSSGQNSEVYECDKFGNLLEHVIEIQHDIKIKQEGYDIILEKGDSIKILESRERPILPIGVVNLTTGQNKVLNNVYEVWNDRKTICEFWQTTDSSSNRLIFGSGSSPSSPDPTVKSFLHDQTRRYLFVAKLIDSCLLSDLPKMINKYGKSLKAYVYK